MIGGDTIYVGQLGDFAVAAFFFHSIVDEGTDVLMVEDRGVEPFVVGPKAYAGKRGGGSNVEENEDEPHRRSRFHHRNRRRS